MKNKVERNKAFVLIEILLVVAAIAILAGIVILALNPSKQLAETRNSERSSDIRSIIDALYQYSIDHNGDFPGDINSNLKMIGTDATGCETTCGNAEGTSSFDFVDESETEFNLGTYTDTQWDSVNSWIELDSTGTTNGTGNFTSDIFDATSNTSWENISWNPEAPYYKELPNGGNSETEYNSGNASMNGNVLLMHMNESSGNLIDSSPNSNNGNNSGADYSIDAKLNNGLRFNSAENDYVTISDNSTLDLTDSGTLMAWIRPESIAGISNWNGIIHKGDQTDFSDEAYFLQFNGWRNLIGGGHNGTSNVYITGSTTFNADQWYHTAITWDGSGLVLYVNGNIDASSSAVLVNRNSSGNLQIGSQFTSGSDYFFDGIIDEVALYNRALSSGEIQSIYNRASLRIKYQIRSCNDDACDTEVFVGPDGTSGTFYSELQNSTSAMPEIEITSIDDNQYFQYRAILENDNNTDTPFINSVSIASGLAGGDTTEDECVDLSSFLIPNYLTDIPVDPVNGDSGKTYYAVKEKGNGRVEVISCKAELDKNLSVSR